MFKQFFCKHTCRISNLKRLSNGMVAAHCTKCLKVLTGECGLALKCKFIPEEK